MQETCNKMGNDAHPIWPFSLQACRCNLFQTKFECNLLITELICQIIHRGYAFVTFTEREAANEAVRQVGTKSNGLPTSSSTEADYI